jgi:hypothetical protein
MTGVPGVNPITGFVIANPEAPPFQVHGGPADPAHSNRGERARPYPWEYIPVGPYPGLMNPIDGIISTTGTASLPAGNLSEDPTGDQTPAYHAAPYPNENPIAESADQVDITNRARGSTRQLLDSLRVHASKTGAGLRRLFDPTMLSKQDDWTAFFNPETGEDIVPNIPGSVSNNAFGVGVNDHVSNAFAKKNAYAFNTSHRHRRYATGPIPGNSMWMKPGGRPMVRTNTGQYNFATSGAFEGDDPGATFGLPGAILSNTPSEYASPPQVNTGPPVIDDETAPAIPLY